MLLPPDKIKNNLAATNTKETHLCGKNGSKFQLLFLFPHHPVSPELKTHPLPKLLPLVLLHFNSPVHDHSYRLLLNNLNTFQRFFYFGFFRKRLLDFFQTVLHNEILNRNKFAFLVIGPARNRGRRCLAGSGGSGCRCGDAGWFCRGRWGQPVHT